MSESPCLCCVVRRPKPRCLSVGRSCSDRAVKLEASVETYRKKLEDLSDLRRQVKTLEEKNMTYMQNTVSLEEELRKANAARTQLETYKRQVVYHFIITLQSVCGFSESRCHYSEMNRNNFTENRQEPACSV